MRMHACMHAGMHTYTYTHRSTDQSLLRYVSTHSARAARPEGLPSPSARPAAADERMRPPPQRTGSNTPGGGARGRARDKRIRQRSRLRRAPLPWGMLGDGSARAMVALTRGVALCAIHELVSASVCQTCKQLLPTMPVNSVYMSPSSSGAAPPPSPVSNMP